MIEVRRIMSQISKIIDWAAMTRLPISYKHGHWYGSWSEQRSPFVHDSFLKALFLVFISMILKPNFHLRRAQVDNPGKLFPFGSG